MPQQGYTAAELKRIHKAVERAGNINDAAEALDLSRSRCTLLYNRARAQLKLPEVRTTPHALNAIRGKAGLRKLVEAEAAFDVAPLPAGDEPIEDLIRRRAVAFERKHAAREARDLVPVNVRLEGAYGILHMGDPHVDDDGCDWPTLLRHLDLIDKTEGLFGANVGDLSNNWVGRLARLYAAQGTTAADAWRMVEWLVKRVRWLYLVGGNHDCWSGAADPVKWFAAQAGVGYQWHGMRLALRSPNGVEVRVNARHDFAGTSQWNGAHAPAKAARMGFRKDHIYTCGHRHSSAHNTLFFEDGAHVAHALRVGAYKAIDDFAEAKGFPRENVPAVVTVVDPDAKNATGLVTVFWDVEAAADYLRWRRSRGNRRAA